MADIKPFCGIRYNPARVPELSKVVTQPYDKITPEIKQDYLAGNEHSFVRLILPDGEDRYHQSSVLCDRWLDEDVLLRDAKPAIYVYHEEFTVLGEHRVRKGFIAVTRVDEFQKGTVLPHERTLSKAKADRLDLLRATHKDYEQIFMLFPDPEREVDKLLEPTGNPDMTATDEYGVAHRVWVVTDPERIRAVRERMADKVLLIADGHHRYETALNLRRETEEQNPNLPPDAALRFKSCAFVNVADPGLVVFPTHRLVRNLPDLDWTGIPTRAEKLFHVTPIPTGEADAHLKEHADKHVFVLHTGKEKTWLLQLIDPASVSNHVNPERSADYRGLDVTILHSIVLEHLIGVSPNDIEDHVKYERDWQKAIARVDQGEFQAALLMNPTRVEQVRTLAGKGERMPQKSTDFYPKLISGLVVFDIGNTETV